MWMSDAQLAQVDMYRQIAGCGSESSSCTDAHAARLSHPTRREALRNLERLSAHVSENLSGVRLRLRFLVHSCVREAVRRHMSYGCRETGAG